MKRIFLLCCISVFAFSCAKDDKPEALTLDLTTLTLHTNEQAVLSALDAKGEKISGQNVEWKSSEPETVSVWAGGSVEAKKIGTATISATYDNQTKTCEVRVEPNIHIAGFQDIGVNRIPTYWKNGQAVSLTDKAGDYANAWSIYVDQGDVYVAGKVFSGRTTRGIYWKNGVGVPLTDGSSSADATSIVVDQGHIYVAGNEGLTAKYWKDGVPITLSDEATVNAIWASNGNVYVAGYGRTSALYWVNGQKTETPADGYVYVNALFVSGNDVYIAGEVRPVDRKPIAQYWKNGSPVALTDGTREAVLNSIWVDGNDVYAAGFQKDDRNVTHATYWKNGAATELDGDVAQGITVVNGQVYTVGWENVSDEMAVAKYWINDKGYVLPNMANGAMVGTVIVVK